MERDKKIAVILAAIISIILFACTVASQLIYKKLLPQVHRVEAVWQEDGYILPKNAVFLSKNGDCIYSIEEVSDGYQVKYFLKEVLVTIVREEKTNVIVRGIYDSECSYAVGVDTVLENGMEVKIAESTNGISEKSVYVDVQIARYVPCVFS